MTPRPRAMILAAGFGTRLGGLSELRPKPMLPICGAPLVRWSVLWLRAQGIREIVINLHHLGEQIIDALGDGSSLGVDIVYSREDDELLGTGGGLRRARPHLDDGRDTPFVVVNGKILLDLDLGPVLAQHRARAAEATMVLRPDPHPERWGNPRADDSPDAVRFLASLRPLMFTGVHVLSPRFLDRVPATGASCIVRTAYAELYRERGEVSRVVTRRYWHEHSTADGYLEGVARVLAGDAELAHAERPLRGVDPSAAVEGGAEIVAPVWVGRRARIEAGARVGPFVQVGDGATVGRGARLTRAVVWDGVRVDEDVVNAVRAR